MKAKVRFVLTLFELVSIPPVLLAVKEFFQVQLLFPEFSGNQEKSVFAEAY